MDSEKRHLTEAEMRCVLQHMRQFPADWFVIGGWAIDLFLGTVTRQHEDLEIGMWREDQGSIRQFFPSHDLSIAMEGPSGGEWVPWDGKSRLDLPVHQVLLRRTGDLPEFELFLNERDADQWIFRPDPMIRAPIQTVVHRTSDGTPFISPEVMLLFKSRHPRPKDDADFRRVMPLLGPEERRWLRDAIATVAPQCEWLESTELRGTEG
jgi:hypothetical protein